MTSTPLTLFYFIEWNIDKFLEFYYQQLEKYKKLKPCNTNMLIPAGYELILQQYNFKYIQ